VSEDDGLAFVSSNCGNTLDTIAVTPGPLAYYGVPGYQMAKTATRPVGAGPDATLFDQQRGRSYTNNIGGDSITVYDAHGSSPPPLATVPLPGAGPIDANFGTGPSGQAWIVTSNGSDDSVSIIDRDRIEACILSVPPIDTCANAVVLTVKTKVPGGAPEGIDYDPVTHRVFTVNKNILGPTLSVIQITEDPTTKALSGEDIRRIPITLAGQTPDAAAGVPALIAFDVVVEKP
jgi:DNA-binding beta-propeller fold protein YncE